MGKWYEEPGPHADAVLCSHVRLARNLSGVPFPSRMSVADRRAVSEKICAAALGENSSLAARFRRVDMETVSKTEAVSLVERRIVSPDFIAERPGRALLVSADESAALMMNDGDHIRIRTAAAGLDLAAAYSDADTLDTILNEFLRFAFDRELGYLTEDPVNLGTGMIASLDLHLPALTESGAIGRLSAGFARIGLSMHGVSGLGLEPKGAAYRLSNQVTLGITEQEAISNLNSMALQMIGKERAEREKLARDLEIQDTVGRSYGILKTARLLSYGEFLELLSAVRFGVATGLIAEVGYGEIGRLAMRVQPAMLARESGGSLSAGERRALRARIVRDTLARTA